MKGFDIVTCTACDFVCVNPRIANDALYSMYANNYFARGTDDVGYEDYELTAHLRIKTFRRWLKIIHAYIGSNIGSVLDIGAASGYFLELMREEGWEVEAIELDPRMVEKLRTKNIPVSNRPFETFETSKKYRLITLFDVLEHIPDLKTTFGKLHELLDDQGALVLITPDINSKQRKLFGKRWFQFKPKEHIQYFSRETLRKAIEPYGLELIHCSSSGQFADTQFLLDRLHKYDFRLLNRIITAGVKLFGLHNRYWYLDTGSLFAVIQKRKT